MRHGSISMGWAGTLLAAIVAGGPAAAAGPQDAARQDAAAPTFAKDVAPILYTHCVSCHRPGDIGPMSLLAYEDARPYARSIRTKVSEGTMPPWHAEAAAGTFKNDRRLTDAEKDTIVKWVDGGAPRGNPGDMPPPPTFAAGWSIGTPDVVLTMAQAFDVPAAGEITYQYFELPTNFTEDKWVQAIELRPGTLSVVHHILAFARDPNAGARKPDFTAKNESNDLEEVRRSRANDRPAQARPRGEGGNRGVLIATTAPGTNAQVFQPGQAMLIQAGSVITFQVHYTASGTAATDRSSIGFVFAKQPAAQEVRSGAFMNTRLEIPPRATDHRVDAAIEFGADARILAIFPHTHLRGKRWEYRLVYPDGRSEVVLSVPRYDFNWQTYYEFTKPLNAPQGTRLEATAHYDNSAANKANPDPDKTVHWGEQTWEEMQYTGITYIVDDKRAAAGQQD
jgi:hypothetical protein